MRPKKFSALLTAVPKGMIRPGSGTDPASLSRGWQWRTNSEFARMSSTQYLRSSRRQAASPAASLAAELGIDEFRAGLLPEGKSEALRELRASSSAPVVMVGDGVNDAPSLKRASVGVSIYNSNNDIALESSDIVLMNGDLTRLPGLVSMSRRTMRTIIAGIVFSLVLNTVATALAVLGIIGPVEGAVVHNVGSVLVIILAAMLLRFDPWRPGRHRVRKKYGPIGMSNG